MTGQPGVALLSGKSLIQLSMLIDKNTYDPIKPYRNADRSNLSCNKHIVIKQNLALIPFEGNDSLSECAAEAFLGQRGDDQTSKI